MMRRLIAVGLLTTVLAGCDLAPHYDRPGPSTPSQFPVGPAYPVAIDQPAGLPWRTMITDTKLRTVIDRALANNQNLSATVANVAAARATYRVQRAAQLPTLTGDAGATIQRGITNSANATNNFDANVGFSSFEIDLFGRQKNLSKQAFEQYLATDAGAHSTRITLIGETATAYVTLASDNDLLAIANDTLQSAARSLKLTQVLHNAGLVAGTDVANAETTVAQTQSDIARYTTQVAQDRNALELLVGATVDQALLPDSLAALEPGISVVPAGVSSTVLAQRPDVLEAEHRLKGANANIGAVRAAFFPTITLTSAIGVASTALGSLFTGGAFSASVSPQASLPILGGANRGNLAYAKAQRDYYAATYRYTVQTAFREVADGLARRGTIDRQRLAQGQLVSAAAMSYRLAEAQYRVGSDTFLNALTAQRTLYTARQTQVSTILADLANRIVLYQSMGLDDLAPAPSG